VAEELIAVRCAVGRASTVDIGKRLRELREAYGLEQAEIEDRPGLLRTYISNVEHGISTPTIRVLEKWANALDIDHYELFVVGDGQPEAAGLPEKTPDGAQERALLGLFGQMPVNDRARSPDSCWRVLRSPRWYPWVSGNSHRHPHSQNPRGILWTMGRTRR
jgi:transcriptional regulator with XRE-family HTH domain